MRVRTFISLLLAPLATLPATAAPASPPNILFILADDLGWTGPSCFGNKDVATPHLDRLAAQGMKFTAAYADAQCSPTRAAFFSGQYGARSGVFKVIHEQEPPRAFHRIPTPNLAMSPDVATLATTLRQAGYATGLSGKWHIADDYPAATLRGRDGGKYFDRYGFDFCNERADRSQPYRDARRFTDDAIRFMRENRAQNFFVYLSYVAVHGPHIVPEEDRLRWTERLQGKDPGIHPDMLASLEFVDLSVGRVLAALDELGLANNTLVVFSSDNGGMSKAVHSAENHPLRMGKGTLYEGGVRVPLFIRWPGHIASGGRSDVPVHFADFFPTLCDAAGVRIDPLHKLDGTSLLPLFRDSVLPERTLFMTFPHYLAGYATTPARAVVRGRYKLVWHPYDHLVFEGGRVTSATSRYVPEPLIELFDVDADPGERTNLAHRYPAKVTEMKELFTAWMKEAGAKDVAPNPAYDARRPMFNTRDEALGAGNAGRK